MMRSITFKVFLSVFTITLFTLVGFGQTEKGSISGTVVDESGAVIPGATVTVTNLGNQTSQTFTTNSQGVYNAPFLVPGSYKVSASASGFSTGVVNEVVVSVGNATRANVSLKPGSVSETVEVNNATPLIQTENASVGQVITAEQLANTPSNGRNIYEFLTLDSTTVNGPTGNAEAFRVESGGSFSVSGTRPSSVTYKIDGQANNDPTFGTPSITPAVDSVKEFQLVNNAYSAEFEGITQVNIASKTGTSGFHGSVYDYVQNDFFQPRNPRRPLDSSGKPGKNRRRFNQFGGTIGGPMWFPNFGEGGPIVDKDNTFFFFSYEGKRNNLATVGFYRVLTQAERSGDLSSYLGGCIMSGGNPVPLLNPNGTPSGNCVREGQIFDPQTTTANPAFNANIPESPFNPRFIRQPFSNNQIPSNRINPNITGIINVQQEAPNFQSNSVESNFTGVSGNDFQNNQWSIRIDHNPTEDDSVYGRYTWQDNTRLIEQVLQYRKRDIDGKGKVFNSAWTHLFNQSMVNEFRFGYISGEYGITVPEVDPTQFGIFNTNKTINTLPGFHLTAGSDLHYGGYTASILTTFQETFQVADNFSVNLGKHNLKMGGKVDFNDFVRGSFTQSNGRLFFNGSFSVGNSGVVPNASRPNSIADFLLGNVSSQSLNFPANAEITNFPWAVYFLDDWKISPRVTLNLGLRYEYHMPWKEKNLGGRVTDVENGVVRVVDPAVAAAANSPLIECCAPRRAVEADKNDFAPRIGIAIQPFKNDSMVIRGGYGVFYQDTSQYFHWGHYIPSIGRPIFSPVLSNFTTPSASFPDPYPVSQISPSTGSGIFVGIPNGVNPAALNNQPVVSGSGLGNYSTPESHQWSVGIQRELWNEMVIDASYKGNFSKNLPLQRYFNQPDFSRTRRDFMSLDPAANPYLRTPYSAFTYNSNIVDNVLESDYWATTVKLERRFKDGFAFLSTYTLSEAKDQGAEVFTINSNFALIADNRNLEYNRGPSVFDVRHRWVTSSTYELPFGKGKPFLNYGGAANLLFGGWRLSGIFTLQSGMPFSIYGRGVNGNTGLITAEYGDRGSVEPYLTGSAWKAALDAWRNGDRLYIVQPGAIDLDYDAPGNLGRNAFRSPYGRRLDLSLSKRIPIRERMRFDLRLDVFDVTREILHKLNIVRSISSNNTLFRSTRGSLPGRDIFFVEHVVQLSGRFTF